MMEVGIYTSGGKEQSYTTESNLLFIGKRKTGKSHALTRIALDLIYENKNVLYIGNDSAEELLTLIPNSRQEETIYFNPSLQPFGFNPLHHVPQGREKALSDGVADTIHTLLTYDSSTPTMDEYIKRGTESLTRIWDSSLLSLYYLLTNASYRSYILDKLKYDPFLTFFWKWFEAYPEKDKRSQVSSTINKLSTFVYDPLLRVCLDQQQNHITPKDGITIVSLDHVGLGQDSASFTGALVIASILAQAENDTELTVIVDEAWRYGSGILERLLNHPKITTVLAIQSLDQVVNFNDILKACEVVALQVSVKDRKELESDFVFPATGDSLKDLQAFQAWVQGDIKATLIELPKHRYTAPPKLKNSKKTVEQRIIDRCKRQCSEPIEKVEKRLRRFF